MARPIKISLTSFSIFLLAAVLAFSILLTKACGISKAKNYYVPAYSYLDIVTGNYRSLVADLFLIRGIISVAEKEPETFDYILDNLRLSARLNPNLAYAYIIGGIVAPRDNKELRLGTLFLQEGMEQIPSDWRLPFWAGFNYLQLGNNLKAAQFYHKASSLAGAPNYVKSMAAHYYYEADRSNIALVYLESMRGSVKEGRSLQNIELKINWLKNIVSLEEKTKLFRQTYGRWPETLDELVRHGLIDKIPDDPFGKGYELDKNRDKYPGRVKSVF